MTRTPLAALTIFASTLAIAGCGTSTSSTPGQTAANTQTTASTGITGEIEAVCAKHNRAIASTTDTAKTARQFREILERHAAVEQATLNQLNKLTIPPTMQPTWKQFTTDRRDLIKTQLTLAQQSGHASVKAILDTEKAEKQLLKTAKKQHLTQCTQQD